MSSVRKGKVGTNVQLELKEDYRAFEDFWFRHCLPNRAAVVKELFGVGTRVIAKKIHTDALPVSQFISN